MIGDMMSIGEYGSQIMRTYPQYVATALAVIVLACATFATLRLYRIATKGIR